MITSHTSINLDLHTCSSVSDINARIINHLLATPSDLFHSTADLSSFKVFTSHTDFLGFTFHDHAVKLADIEQPCSNPAKRNSELPNLKEDYSYAFIPNFLQPRSGCIMGASTMSSVLTSLREHGFHVAWVYDQFLFGKRVD
jgi:hypothetical protein